MPTDGTHYSPARLKKPWCVEITLSFQADISCLQNRQRISLVYGKSHTQVDNWCLGRLWNSMATAASLKSKGLSAVRTACRAFAIQF